MENVAVMLIDESNDYRFNLETFLKRHGIIVLGSFTQKEFMDQRKLAAVPDILIISYETPRFHTDLNVMYIKRAYQSVKILINSSETSPATVEKVKAMEVAGLVFKNEKGFDQILRALDALHQGRPYFAMP